VGLGLGPGYLSVGAARKKVAVIGEEFFVEPEIGAASSRRGEAAPEREGSCGGPGVGAAGVVLGVPSAGGVVVPVGEDVLSGGTIRPGVRTQR